MIKGTCHTNLDGYESDSWPTMFISVPNKGDRVLSICGNKSLKVCGITHTQFTRPGSVNEVNYSGLKAESFPCIKVELNK